MKKHFLLLALAAICSLSVWAEDYTSEWDGWAWRENLPGANVASNKNDIVVTSTFAPVEESMWNQNGHAFDLQGQADGHIDITTVESANWEFSDVMIETWYRNGDTKNTVYIQFYTSSSIDDTQKNGNPIVLNADGQNYLGVWKQVPAGSRSARIYRTATNVGPFVYGIHITTQKQVSVFHTVHFVAGDGQGEMEDISVGDGRTISLPAPQGLYYSGHTCIGWSDGSTTYTIGQAYTVEGEVTFTAQWEEGYFAEWGYLGKGIAGTDNFLTKTAFPSKTASVVGEITLTSTAETDGWYKNLSTDVTTASSLNYLAVHNNTLTVTGSLSQNKVLTEVIIAWTDFTGGGGLQISFYSATNNQVGETKTIPVTSMSGLQVRTTFPAPEDAVSFVLKKTTSGDEWNTAVSYIKVSAKDGAAPTEAYTVSFNTQGGSSVASLTENTPGSGITLPAAPTKSGYIFDGWYTAATGGTLAGAIGATYYPAENCTLHAHWAGFAKSTDFAYVIHNYSPRPTVEKCLEDSNYTMNPFGDTSWDGNGYDHPDCGLKSDFGDREFSFWVKGNSNVTITLGTWKGNRGGGPELYANGTKKADLAAKTENGPYTTTEVTKFVIKIVDPEWSVIKKIDIKALDFTLTLNAGDGTGDDVVVKLKENATYPLNVPEGFSKDGYHFKEWSDGTTTYAAGATFTMPANNVTMTAIWEEDSEVEYTVTYAAGGGEWVTEPTENDHKAGETFTLPASSVVSRTGYQFAGWNDGTTTFAAEATYTMPAKAVILTAQWNKLYTVTYAAGCEGYTGTLPTQDPQIDGAKFTIPAAGIKRQGYAFKGWNDTHNTYQPGHEYTMPASNLVFTAQWEAVTVPTVTDLAITEPVNEIVPLSWNIPGLVDMSKHTIPNPQINNSASELYGEASDTKSHKLTSNGVEVQCQVAQYENDGVAFPIPASNVEWVDFDYFISSRNNVSLLGGVCTNNDFYWDAENLLTQENTWTNHRSPITHKCWNSTKDASSFNQVAIMANAGSGGGSVSFTVRNVRYHTTGMSDIEIAKVTLVRKAGSASASPTDGDVLINEQVAFNFTDKDAKEPGTYYYTVFAYDAEGNYSAAVTEEYVLEVKQTYTVTYAAGGAQGEVPVDEMPKVEGTKFNLSAPGDLLKPYCQFNGWSDGTDTYAAGDEYIMPADNVTFTAQWGAEEQGLRIPENTVRLNYANKAETSTDLGTYNQMGDGETWINLGDVSHSKLYSEWNVYIQPCQYTVECYYGVNEWNTKYILKLIDPVTGQEIKAENGTLSNGEQKIVTKTDIYTWDLSSLTMGKRYIVRIIENWDGGGSRIKVHHIDFIPTITIDQSKEDNLIFNGKANVTLIRPLATGTTNSICLPFALDRDQINTAFGEDAEVWALSSSKLSDNNMTLEIEFEQVNEMEAGKPYLIQPGTGYDANVNPVFNEIEMSTTLAPVVHYNLDFIGTVQKSFVSVGYKDHLFVGADNMVYYPSGSGDLNGMRAYFKIKYNEEAGVPASVSARMILGKTTPTELRTPKATDSVRKVMKEGRIYIIRNGVVNDMFGNTVK